MFWRVALDCHVANASRNDEEGKCGCPNDGGQLVVYGIEDADWLSLHGASDMIVDAVAWYTNNELASAELSRATLMVTDLLADELDFVLSLPPRGQNCTLGITKGAQAGWTFAGFDHRIAEDREMAMSLGELRDRLRSFGSTERPGVHAACCAHCGHSAAMAVTRSKEKGLLKIVDREGRDAPCCEAARRWPLCKLGRAGHQPGTACCATHLKIRKPRHSVLAHRAVDRVEQPGFEALRAEAVGVHSARGRCDAVSDTNCLKL